MLKFSAHLITVCYFYTAMAYSYAQEAKLELINGDTWQGEIVKLSPQFLHFKHDAFKSESQTHVLKTEKIRSIVYTNQNNESSSSIGAHLRMFGRIHEEIPLDLYKGSIQSIDKDRIILNTSYAGALPIHKNFVQKLQIFNNNEIILNGLGSLSDWKTNSSDYNITEEGESFTFHRTPSGPVSRGIHKEINLTKNYQLNFTFDTGKNTRSKSANDPRIDITLNANETGIRAKNSIVLSATHNQIFASYTDDFNVRATIGKSPFPAHLKLKDSLNYSVYVDTEKSTFSFYIEGNPIFKKLSLGRLNASKIEKFFSFKTQSYVPCKLSNFQIKRWTGPLPTPANSQDNIPLTGQIGKAITLQNGDIIYGSIDSIDNEIASINTKYGKYKLRLNKISSLDLGITENNEIAMEKNDARLTFLDGSKFIIKIEHIENGKIRGSSDCFIGSQEFDISTLTRIEFEKSIYVY